MREEDVRNFYRRFAATLPEAEDQEAFERQIEQAVIIPVDDEHDRFDFPSGLGASEALNEDTLVGIYPDDDGQDVNVIMHFVGDHLSWAERYRNLGDKVRRWPPPLNSPLRLGREWPPA